MPQRDDSPARPLDCYISPRGHGYTFAAQIASTSPKFQRVPARAISVGAGCSVSLYWHDDACREMYERICASRRRSRCLTSDASSQNSIRRRRTLSIPRSVPYTCTQTTGCLASKTDPGLTSGDCLLSALSDPREGADLHREIMTRNSAAVWPLPRARRTRAHRWDL